MKRNKSLISFIFILVFFLPFKTFASRSPTINEFLAHPSSGNKEWVEFYNPESIDFSDYFLDDDLDFNDDTGNSSKKSLTMINNSNPLYPYFELNSFFNNSGDYVVLFSPDGKIIDQYQYTEDPGADISIGRFPDGNGEFALLSLETKGNPNSSPPTPTSLPKPTSAPTNTIAPTKTITSKNSSKIPTAVPTEFNSLPTVISTVNPSIYKVVLGKKKELTVKVSGEKASTSSSKKKTEENSNEVKTLGATQNNLSKFLLLGVGVFLIVVCGILFTRKYIKKTADGEND